MSILDIARNSIDVNLLERIACKVRRRIEWSYNPGSRLEQKHLDPAKLIDRFERYQKITGVEINFEDKRVLELGGGPLLGWAYLAKARGAAHYVFNDMALNESLIHTDKAKRYFAEHVKLINQYYKKTLSSDLIVDNFLELSNEKAEELKIKNASVDLVISNSFLEHPNDPLGVFEELKRVLAPGGVQYHFVDFSNHLGTFDPFEKLYAVPKENVHDVEPTLNGLRVSEWLALAEKAGFNQSKFVPYLVESESLSSIVNADESWKKLGNNDLASRCGWIVIS